MAALSISDLRLNGSPDRPEALRLSVRVTYPGLLSRPERLWFDIPKPLGDGIEEGGNPWLVTLLPLAVTHRWSISMDMPVDSRLLYNLQELMRIWHDWYPDLDPVGIDVDARAPSHDPLPSKTGLFFSGGVDSFYSLLHAEATGTEDIDDLILIHGFDIPVDNDPAFQRVHGLAQLVANGVGKTLIPITTNARQTRFVEADWGGLAFGGLLAASGLTLGTRYRRLLISSGLLPGRLHPHGSHPETDPLYSTARTSVAQYAPEADRIPKLEFLRSWPLAIDHLRVCFDSSSGENCGHCRKCLAVMAFLEIHGELAESRAFPGGPLDLDRLSRVYMSSGLNTYRSLQSYARKHERGDIADAIERAFVRTQALDRRLGLKWVRRVRERSMAHPLLRRSTRWMRPFLWRLGLALNRRLPW